MSSTHRCRIVDVAAPGVLLALVLVARTALAQSPRQRSALESFRDSLAVVRDSTALSELERGMIVRASHAARDSAMIHLQLGFVALRLGDVAGRHHFEDAASEFQWVTELQSQWPYGWLGLGLAELGVGDADVAVIRGLQAALGKDALTRSAGDFARSAEVDPSFVRGLVELANTALRQRINLRLDVALTALRRAAHTPAGSNPEVLLARAQVERAVGSPDSARVAIDALATREPSNPGVLLELARVRFALARRDGAEPWYRGLATADAAALDSYRADLIFVLPDSLRHRFDAATGPARVVMMRRFWSVRDRDELRATGDRLIEHYRRLEYARRNYRLASTHRHYDIVERYRPPVAEFDDRGVIYIRHGTPDDRASLALPGVALNESWVYHRTGLPDLLFHFVAREGVTDFRLVESALDILGYASAVRMENTGDVQGRDAPMVQNYLNRLTRISSDSASRLRQRFSDAAMSRTAEAILRSRQGLNPLYSRLIASGRGSASGLEAEERTLGSRSIRVGTTTDSWDRRWPGALHATAVVFAAGGDSAAPTVRIAYAIPVGEFAPGDTFARVRAAVLGIGDTIDAVIDTVDTGARNLTTSTGNQRLGMVALQVPPGRYTARIGLETGRAGVVGSRDTITVAGRAPPQIALSDLVLGSRTLPLFWTASSGDTVWANPLATFRASDPMQLYFEVSGVSRDSGYRVAIVIRHPGGHSLWNRVGRIFGAGGAALRIAFRPRPAESPVNGIHREVALQKLDPGRYVLEVTVSAAGGDPVTRRQDFTVVR